MSQIITADLAAKLDCNVGEGPFWDDTKEELYFVDITNKEIKIFNPDSKSIKTIQFDQEISAVFLDHELELIVAARDGIFVATRDGVLKGYLRPSN